MIQRPNRQDNQPDTLLVHHQRVLLNNHPQSRHHLPLLCLLLNQPMSLLRYHRGSLLGNPRRCPLPDPLGFQPHSLLACQLGPQLEFLLVSRRLFLLPLLPVNLPVFRQGNLLAILLDFQQDTPRRVRQANHLVDLQVDLPVCPRAVRRAALQVRQLAIHRDDPV